MNDDELKPRPAADPRRVFLGAALMLVGIAFLAENAGWWDATPYWGLWRFWPVLLIVGGLVRVLFPRADEAGKGFWEVAVGLMLLAHSLDVLPFSKSWPLFLLLGGASIAWKALRGEKEGIRGH